MVEAVIRANFLIPILLLKWRLAGPPNVPVDGAFILKANGLARGRGQRAPVKRGLTVGPSAVSVVL